MESLGSALSHLFHGDEHRLSPQERSRLSLLDLPTATTHSEELAAARATLARIDQQIAARAGKPPATADGLLLAGRRDAETQVAALEARAAQFQERARIQATRPAGCWCLGLGGRGILTFDDAGEKLWSHPCGCPEGRAVQRRIAREDAAWAAQRTAEAAAAETADHARRLTESRIPYDMREWSFASLCAIAPRRAGAARFLREWATLSRFPVQDGARRGTGVFLTGRKGVGKTSLAVSMLRHWIDQGGWGRFVVPVEYFDTLRASFHSDDPDLLAEAARLERDVQRAQLLVLDDLGAERTSPWVAERVFRIVNTRMNEQRPMIITSNYTIEETARRICAHHEGSTTAVERLHSRLRKVCNIVTLASAEGDVDDLRLRAVQTGEVL